MREHIGVVKLVEKWDMRAIHSLRLGRAAQALKPGTCIVAFNKRETIAMIVDSRGGVYHAYEPDGFDLTALTEEIKLGLAVVLVDKTKTAHKRRIGGRHLRHAA